MVGTPRGKREPTNLAQTLEITNTRSNKHTYYVDTKTLLLVVVLEKLTLALWVVILTTKK
jgi:hypothetical protein